MELTASPAAVKQLQLPLLVFFAQAVAGILLALVNESEVSIA